jgi:hypothetical protein
MNVELNLPLQLQCFRVPVRWSYETDKGGPVYQAQIDQRLLSDCLGDGPVLKVRKDTNAGKLGKYDPWKLRLRFLEVNLDSPTTVLEFLNDVGLFSPPDHSFHDENRVVAIEALDGIHAYNWDSVKPVVADDLEEALRFCKEWPCQLSDPSGAIFRSRVATMREWDFGFGRLGYTPKMFLTAVSFYESYQIAFAIDQITKAKKVRCNRLKCAKTFTHTGNRRRLYCSAECGHAEAVRALRQRQRE